MLFSQTLAAKMEERDISVRRLAAKWRPANPESGRRNLYKYLNEGQEPSARVVAEIAEALDVPVKDLASGDEADEEVDQLDLLADLVAQLQRLVEAQSKKKAAA